MPSRVTCQFPYPVSSASDSFQPISTAQSASLLGIRDERARSTHDWNGWGLNRPIPCWRSGIPDGEGARTMDRSAWAISLVAAVVSWYLPGPCAAQSPPKSMPQSPPQFLPPLEPPMDTPATPRREPAAPALTASELLPALKPLTDPLADPSRESSVSPGKHAGVQSPLMTDTASAVRASGCRF